MKTPETLKIEAILHQQRDQASIEATQPHIHYVA